MKTESRKFGRIGQLLPVKDAQSRGDGTQTRDNDRWESIVEQGLRKTYRQGRRRMRQVVANAETSDDEWHELRKRVKDLGYQLTLLKKVKGIKPLLKKLDDVGTALGDARDLTLLRDSLGNVQEKNELTPAAHWDYQRLLTHIEERSQELHRHALKVIGGVYRRKSKRFATRLERRFPSVARRITLLPNFLNLNGRVGTTPVYPLTLVEARAIGLMTITDREEVDHKVVAVHVNDPDFDIYHEARELPQHRLTVLKRFFMDYKVLENKEVIVGDILPAKQAEQIIEHSLANYRLEFG
jgi:hypothetical protein